MRILLAALIIIAAAALAGAQTVTPFVQDTNDHTVQFAADVKFTWTADDSTFEFQKPTQFMWEFGDGSHGTGNPITHRYTKAGEFKVFLVTSDSRGNQQNYRRLVKIRTQVEFPQLSDRP